MKNSVRTEVATPAGLITVSTVRVGGRWETALVHRGQVCVSETTSKKDAAMIGHDATVALVRDNVVYDPHSRRHAAILSCMEDIGAPALMTRTKRTRIARSR